MDQTTLPTPTSYTEGHDAASCPILLAFRAGQTVTSSDATINFWDLAAQGKALPLTDSLVEWAGLADLGWTR
jgi:hypothetical protein